MSARSANHRIRLLVVVFAVAFTATLARAAWIQGVHAGSYDRLASNQQLETLQIPAGRGTIFDRNGKPLAIGEQATTVYADPTQVVDPRRAALAVGKTLGLDPDEVYRSIADRDSSFVYLSRKTDPIRAAALQRREIAGIGFYPEELRWYPQRQVAAHLLGFAGVDNRGLEGLERSLDRKLAGQPGSETIVRDPNGRVIDVVRSQPERPGQNVVLTIDHQIQATAEELLTEALWRWGARAATAIVLDPRTGAVLAMANAPSFDANRFAKAPADRRRNRAVTDLYEPGSTFKLVTIGAALEERVVTPGTTFTLAPTIEVADRVIREAHSRGTQTMTVKRILSESSNVGTVTIAQRLGAGRLAHWIDRFGFGTSTGVDLPGESEGLVLPLDRWSGSTIGTVPIGQGIAVTPMQMVSAYAAIGNGGVLQKPYVLDKIGGKRVKHGSSRRIVSERTAGALLSMLRSVVVEGTGTGAAVPGYTVAGKTGTAAKPENGVYVSKYVASFVGLVPAKKPRLAIMVAVDEPHGAIWGGVVAAPVFAELARFCLQYLGVAPDARPAEAATR